VGPIGRLDLFIVLRNQLADRGLVRRAIAVEAVMEELARAVGADAALWGLAGLGADIDARLAERNPERRGEVAEELLLTEGVPAEAAAAARRFRRGEVGELGPIARGLVAASWLVDRIAVELDEPGASLDGLEPRALEHRLRRAARREDAAAVRALACLEALALEPARAAEVAVAAHVRVREDLGR
jgi:predicted hydrolase (HD superfamily)